MLFHKHVIGILHYILIGCILQWQLSSIFSIAPAYAADNTNIQAKGTDSRGFHISESEKKRIAAKELREAESTSENNKAMELFYRAVEAMNYDELVGATADVEKKTGILGGSSSTLDHTVKSEVLPNNAAASMDENGRMKNDNHRRKMYSKCLSDAEKKYDKCSSEPIPRNCGWIRHRDKRTCKNKWVPSNHQKLAEARAVNNGSGARARTSHAKADGHRADSYSKSDSLYAAVRNKIDLTNAGAMRALKLAKQARNEAMAQLVGSKNDDFKTTKASVERIITKKEVDRIFELSTDLNEATVRNVDILSVSAGCTTDFDCSKLGDTFSISYYLFIAASAIYLAEQIRIKNDYSVNIREIMESNPDDDQKYDEQTVQMMKAANIRNETNDFAVRLTKTKANVKEMYIWVDKIAQWEYRSMVARMAAADAQVASADAAKESTEAKKKHGIDWRALALVIVIICIAIMVACCAPTPPACCAPAAIAYRVAVGILIAAIAFLLLSTNQDGEAGQRQARAAEEKKAAKLHTKMKCSKPKLDDKIHVLPVSKSKMDHKWLFSSIQILVNEFFPMKLACAESTISSSTGIKKGTGIYKFFIEEKKSHSAMMSGHHGDHQDMGFGDPEDRIEYTRLLAGLGSVVHLDMEGMTNPNLEEQNKTYTDLSGSMMKKFGSQKVVGTKISGQISANVVEVEGVRVDAVGEAVNIDGHESSGNIPMKGDSQSDFGQKKISGGDNLKDRKGDFDSSSGSGAGKLRALRRKLNDRINERRRKLGQDEISDDKYDSADYRNKAEDFFNSNVESTLAKMTGVASGGKDSQLAKLLSMLKMRRKRGKRGSTGEGEFSAGYHSDYAPKMNYGGGDSGDYNAASVGDDIGDGRGGMNGEGVGGVENALMKDGEFAGEYDADALEKERHKYRSNEMDSLWRKVTKAYIRIGYPVLLRKRK